MGKVLSVHDLRDKYLWSGINESINRITKDWKLNWGLTCINQDANWSAGEPLNRGRRLPSYINKGSLLRDGHRTTLDQLQEHDSCICRCSVPLRFWALLSAYGWARANIDPISNVTLTQGRKVRVLQTSLPGKSQSWRYPLGSKWRALGDCNSSLHWRRCLP